MEENNIKSPKPVLGLILASFLGILAAIFWAMIVQVTGYNIGFAAIAVGFIVSQGFAWAGKSDSIMWGVVAACIAALSIFLGKVLVAVFSVAEFYDVSFLEMLPLIRYDQMMLFIVDTFEFFDLAFYAIAIQTAFKRSFNKASENYDEYLNPEYKLPT